jgi:membrane protease YdiL (CAAX protease family)
MLSDMMRSKTRWSIRLTLLLLQVTWSHAAAAHVGELIDPACLGDTTRFKRIPTTLLLLLLLLFLPLLYRSHLWLSSPTPPAWVTRPASSAL